MPIDKIVYNNGYDCVFSAAYFYDLDSTGFYLMDSNGGQLRKALPFRLISPAWSHDGKWLAFTSGGQILKMPFDGTSLDTTSIVQLTTSDNNFLPSWSPDDQWIAFDSNRDSPDGANFIWKVKSDGTGLRRITLDNKTGEIRAPSWSNDYSIAHIRYAGLAEPEVYTMDSAGNSVKRLTDDMDRAWRPMFLQDTKSINYIGSTPNSSGNWPNVLNVNLETKVKTPVTTFGVAEFSLSTTGKMVYVRFNSTRIDRIEGTLWVSDADGRNSQQIGFNSFIEVIK